MNAILNHSPICARDKYAQTAKVLLVDGTSGTKQPQVRKYFGHILTTTQVGGVEIAELVPRVDGGPLATTSESGCYIDARFHVIDSDSLA